MFITCLQCTQHKVVVLVDCFKLTFIPVELEGEFVDVKLVVALNPDKEIVEDHSLIPNLVRSRAHDKAFLAINNKRKVLNHVV